MDCRTVDIFHQMAEQKGRSEAKQLILPYTAVTASGLCNSAMVTELTYQ